jgi:hypothetical protein
VPTSLAIVDGPTQPLTAGVTSAKNVVVILLDQFDNFLNQGSALVKLSAVAGPGKTLNLGAVNMVKGVATFKHVTINTAGTFELGASSKGVASDFGEIEVLPAAPANIVFVKPPPNTTAGAQFSVQVELLDKFGNLCSDDSVSTVTLALTGSSAGTLSGTTTRAVHEGVVTFPGLSVSASGKYKIIVTSNATNKTGTSGVFNVA